MKVVASFDRWIREANEGSAGALISLYDGLYDVGYRMAASLLDEPEVRDEVVFSVFVERWLMNVGFDEIDTTRNALNLAVREKCKEIHKVGLDRGAASWIRQVPVLGGFHPLMLETAYKSELTKYERTPWQIKKTLFYLFLLRKREPEIARLIMRSEEAICRYRDDGIKFLIVLRSSQAGRYQK